MPRKKFHAKVTRSIVRDVPGHPVAASCTIMHCHYFELEKQLKQAEQDRDEADQVRERLAALLDAAAIALNGPEPPLTKWSFHDVPEKIRALQDRVRELESRP